MQDTGVPGGNSDFSDDAATVVLRNGLWLLGGGLLYAGYRRCRRR